MTFDKQSNGRRIVIAGRSVNSQQCDTGINGERRTVCWSRQSTRTAAGTTPLSILHLAVFVSFAHQLTAQVRSHELTRRTTGSERRTTNVCLSWLTNIWNCEQTTVSATSATPAERASFPYSPRTTALSNQSHKSTHTSMYDFISVARYCFGISLCHVQCRHCVVKNRLIVSPNFLTIYWGHWTHRRYKISRGTLSTGAINVQGSKFLQIGPIAFYLDNVWVYEIGP